MLEGLKVEEDGAGDPTTPALLQRF